jgi:hypothetical protein
MHLTHLTLILLLTIISVTTLISILTLNTLRFTEGSNPAKVREVLNLIREDIDAFQASRLSRVLSKGRLLLL